MLMHKESQRSMSSCPKFQAVCHVTDFNPSYLFRSVALQQSKALLGEMHPLTSYSCNDAFLMYNSVKPVLVPRTIRHTFPIMASLVAVIY